MSRCQALWQLCARRWMKPEADDRSLKRSHEISGVVAKEGHPVSEERPLAPRRPLLLRRISSMERRMNRWLLLVDRRLELQRISLVAPHPSEALPA